MSSPGVETFEKDLTFNVQSITSNATGYAGLFRWGPMDDIVKITTNESELATRFGKPDPKTALYFLSAANYLLYSAPLYVVRASTDGALNAVASGGTPMLVRNDSDYGNVGSGLDGISFIGRFAGALGNSIKVSAADSTSYDTWDYADEFEYSPDSGEFNMVVIDEDGIITGSAGRVIERYSLLTKNPGDTRPDGTTAYVTRVLENQSNYILVGDTDAIDFAVSGSEGVFETSLEGGVDDNVAENADFDTAIAIFDNEETVEIARAFCSGMPSMFTSKMIGITETRGDSVTFVAPELEDVFNALTPETNVTEYFNETINKNSSYGFYVDNWKMVYDKYNDNKVWIPCDSDAAGLHARVFTQNEPWFSIAGLNRGQLKNVIKLAWNPNKLRRNVLYRNNINSIISFPGEGYVLFGDKTGLRRPSAFSRINVRSLLIVLKKSIARSARYQLFEFNDMITRGVFRNGVDQYLDNVKSRRGLLGKKVVCDDSNNTAQVIDANEFVGDIYLKPNKSINKIRLNFNAVGTGVDFQEFEFV